MGQTQRVQGDLGSGVLRDVSRSFYLSMRFLPPGFREPISVGYLLARLSDTIADAGGSSVSVRKALLADFRKSFEISGLDQLMDVSGGEQVLLGRAEDCLVALAGLPEWQQAAVKKVVEIITTGQSWDLTRFEAEGVVRLNDRDELRQYTYQVAGCVGEFWTEIGFGLSDFAEESFEQMRDWGRAYGQSLQLVNILRDRDEDLAIGREYISDKDTSYWISEAYRGFDLAERYCRALHGRRVRFATWLPLLIGRETLELIEKAPEVRAKVSRSRVRRLMWQAVQNALR